MTGKKEKRKYNTNYQCNKCHPFMLVLEAAILNDGYKTIKEFIRKQIQGGKNFHEIHNFIVEKYKSRSKIKVIKLFY